MRFSGVPLLSFIVTIILFSLLQTPSFAVGKKSFVVYLGAHTHGPEVTSSDLEKATDSHHQLLSTVVGSHEKARDAIFYSYTRYINGFAATLDEEQAREISKNPNVISVFESRARHLHTTRSWSFLGLESDSGEISSHSAWEMARYGQDTIIANIDTGVWPESKSFSDEGMGPIPSRWKGFCQNNTKEGVPCNRKLIGARYFNNGYAAYVAQIDPSRVPVNASARDDDGHGTHTLATAGGNFVSGANVFGLGNGTAKGGSPKARVAAYKVCWTSVNNSGGGCFEADILAAFEAAIHDGVDIISASIGGPPNNHDYYFTDALAIGSLHAVKHGITVIMSAGNDGPAEGSVSNVAPWLLTVGANTIDRKFPVKIGLGNKKHLKGESLYPKVLPVRKFYPLIYGTAAKAANSTADDAQLCLAGSLDPEKVKGKILACLRDTTDDGPVEKGVVALQAGAVGMILANDISSGNEVVADPHVLPAAHISYTDGLTLFSFINSTKSPDAYMTRARTQNGVKPAPVMAAFSSRGPNTITPEILKPDVTAPGVAIIAAYTQAVSLAGETDHRRVLFNSESGTSMSCPHVAAVAGLLKTLHPHWSPSAIKSAIMTTARTKDNQKMEMRNSSNLQATPFSYGSGQVRPNAAMDPGLVYDATTTDYLNFLCALGYNEPQLQTLAAEGVPYECNHQRSSSLTDFNYPSITVPDLEGATSVTRTVKNVGTPGVYRARIHAPKGLKVSVEPKTLAFKKIGEEKTFKVHLQVVNASDEYSFGSLTWTDGVHFVRSPIVVQSY